MRILANYQQKVGRENYGSECFTVTVECDLDMSIGSVGETADALFVEARSAVERQITGTTKAATPATSIPAKDEATEPAKPQQETPKPTTATNGQPVTEKQRSMIFKMLRDNFENRTDEQTFLKEQVNVERVDNLTRKQASRVIEALMDRQRNAA